MKFDQLPEPLRETLLLEYEDHCWKMMDDIEVEMLANFMALPEIQQQWQKFRQLVFDTEFGSECWDEFLCTKGLRG